MLTVSSIKKEKELPDDFTQRRGVFKVSKGLLDNISRDLMEFMGLFFIVRAEYMLDENAIHYIGYSTLFDPIDRFEEAPEYNFHIEKKATGEIKVKAIRQQEGKKLLRLLRRIDG